jgi:vacuolar-type H+-ATPase subunit H
MNDQPTSPDQGGRAPLGGSGNRATERVQLIIEAAEQAAAGIISDAEVQAKAFLDEARQRADLIAGERAREMWGLTDDLIQRAEAVRRQSDELLRALDDARRGVEEALRAGPALGAVNPAAPGPAGPPPEPPPVSSGLYASATSPPGYFGGAAARPLQELPSQPPPSPASRPPASWPSTSPQAPPPPAPAAPPPPAPQAQGPPPQAQQPQAAPAAWQPQAGPSAHAPMWSPPPVGEPPPVPPPPGTPPPHAASPPPPSPHPSAWGGTPAESSPAGQPPPASGHPPPGTLGSQPSEGARLLATQMAVAGSSREEIEGRLQHEFGIRETGPMLDAILGPER